MKRILLYFFLAFCANNASAQLINNNILISTVTNYVIAVDAPSPLSVVYGTTYASLTLPSTVVVHLSNGTAKNYSVTWSSTGYDGNAAGLQTLGGTITYPSPVTNPFLIQATIDVDVQEQIIVDDFTAPTGFQTYEILAGVDTLSLIEVIGGGASGGSIGTINRAPGSGGGAYAWRVDQPVTAGDIAAVYIAPDVLATAPAGGNVDGNPGHPSYFGPSAPAGSTIISGSGAPGGGTGSDGNYYSDITTGNLYGPKASGSWPGSPSAPWVRAAGGSGGTGISPGTGGQGGLASNSVGTGAYDGGDGIAAPASRSGAGGAAASSAGAGANATTSGGTNSVGGVGVAPGGSGGNGSTGTPGLATNYGGGGAGARSTTVTNVLGGTGKQGWAQITFSGASVPPAAPGAAYNVAVWGQSNVISPGNGSPGSPYTGVLESQIYINSTTGFEPLEYGVNNNPGGSLTGLGPELGIANVIDALAVNETYIIKKGQSGTSMHTNWNVANNSTGRTAVTQLIAAINFQLAQGKTIEEIYIVFRQGEADIPSTNPNGPSGSNVEAEYKDKLQDLIAYTIDKLEASTGTGGADLDLTVVEFHWITILVDNTTTADHAFQTEIISAQTDGTLDFDTDRPTYASKTAGLHTVSTAGLGTVDGIHFSTSAEITIGTSAAAFMTITP